MERISMAWHKPDDLELVAECESLPEVEIVRGLLASAAVESVIMTTTDSTMVFSQKSIFGKLAKRRPYKVLVRPEDAEVAREILSAEEELPDESELPEEDE